MIRVRHLHVASFLLLAATFPAAAEEVAGNAQPQAAATAPAAAPVAVAAAPVAVVAAPTASKSAPWSGSSVTYGTAASTYSFSRAADPFYDPVVSHHLELAPQWKLNDQFLMRGLVELSQELTLGDTEYAHQLILSDATVDAVYTGWKEPVSGVKIAGDLRFTAPTSMVAHAQSRILSVGPRLALSRHFDVRNGLTVGYESRYTRRFYKYTTAGFDESPIAAACTNPESATCAELQGTGRRNVREDISHGPTVMFEPLDKLSITGVFRLMHGFLYPVTEVGYPVGTSPYADPDRVRLNALFALSATYPVMKFLSVTAGATTFTPYPDSTGGDRNPFINRYTTLSLDLGVDLEALLSRS